MARKKKRGKNAANRSLASKQKAHQRIADRPKSKARKLLLVATTALFQILPHFNNGSQAVLNVRDLYNAIFS